MDCYYSDTCIYIYIYLLYSTLDLKILDNAIWSVYWKCYANWLVYLVRSGMIPELTTTDRKNRQNIFAVSFFLPGPLLRKNGAKVNKCNTTTAENGANQIQATQELWIGKNPTPSDCQRETHENISFSSPPRFLRNIGLTTDPDTKIISQKGFCRVPEMCYSSPPFLLFADMDNDKNYKFVSSG